MEARTIQRSFAGGEMSPHMQARVDDVKFQNGYKRGRNMLVTSTGNLQRRPGFARDAGAKHNDKQHRLIPFVYSIDQALVIELGEEYFRFHQNGAPVRYATPLTVASIDTAPAAESITFTAAHGLTDGTLIQFTAESGLNADIPGGLTAGTSYTVTVVDAKTITVATDLTSSGTGTIYAWRNSEMPADWATNTHTFDSTDVNTTTNSISEVAHGYAAGQAVRFTSTGSLPDPIVAGVNYYIRPDGPDAYGVTVVDDIDYYTLPGFDLDLLSGGPGTHTVRKVYRHGELVYRTGATTHGVYRCVADVEADTAPESDAANWMLQPVTGEIEVASPYQEADLFEIGYDGENDVVTLTHEGYAAAELRYHGSNRWSYTEIAFGPTLAAPAEVGVTPAYGDYQTFTFGTTNPTLFTRSGSGGHGLVVNDTMYVEATIGSGSSFGGQTAGYYVVAHVGAPSASGEPVDLWLRRSDGGAILGGLSAGTCVMRYASLGAETTNSYRITSVAADGTESEPSEVATQENNNLTIEGSSNLIEWTAVPTAVNYNVYKALNGLYGFLAQVDGSIEGDVSLGGPGSFYRDDNSLLPDLARTLPLQDETLGGGDNRHPRAVTHFEQRRFFACTNREPQTIWATRSATESDLSFHLPTVDDDRLQFELKSREAIAINHLVPLEQLVVLSNSTEFRVLPVNSDVLTPSTIDARAVDYVGCSRVKPSVLSGNVVFCGSRGGHVYEMGYRQDGLGLSKPGDLCLRSNHLFDNKTIVDQIVAKAPQPLLLFTSSTGQLLMLTYVPQEQIGAWHVHETDGAIESVCVIPEGNEDRIYVSSRRTVDGNTVRSIERMGVQLFSSLRESNFTDAGGTFDGRATDGSTMTVTGGTTWEFGDTVTITASTVQFVLGSGDVGDEIALWLDDDEETLYRVRITAVSTNKIATGTLRQDLPTDLQDIATTSWGFARDTISLSHLEGATVEILADGLQQDDREVASGLVTLDGPALIVQVGLPAPAELDTLPLWMQVEALGQGRPKNVSHTWIKVVDSGAFEIGPTEDNLVPAVPQEEAGSGLADEIDTLIMPAYSQGGEIVIRTSGPLPLTILGCVFSVEVGG